MSGAMGCGEEAFISRRGKFKAGRFSKRQQASHASSFKDPGGGLIQTTRRIPTEEFLWMWVGCFKLMALAFLQGWADP